MKKRCAGRYKIPEMFPGFCFPKGYTITNHNESHLKLEILKGEKNCYFQYIAAGEAANVWLQPDTILTADHAFEISEMV